MERSGRWLLHAGFVVCVALTLVLAWVAPPLALLALPVGVVAAAVALALAGRPSTALPSVLLGSLLLMGYSEQSNVGSLLYAAYFGLFVLLWYGDRVLAGVPIVRSRTDAAMMVFLVGGMVSGTVVGLFMGATPAMVIGELRPFVMLLLYFPIRETVRADPRGPVMVAACIVTIGLGVAVWNAYAVWQAFRSADALWKIIDVRTAYGESTLALAFLVSLGLLIGATQRRWQMALAGVVAALLVGLLLTKSRGYWVSTLLGVGALMVALPTRQRMQMVRLSLLVTVTLTVLAVVFLGDYLSLLVAGVWKRFATLGTASTADVSLINRFSEAGAALDRLQHNPILGFGFGTRLTRFDMILQKTSHASFIHNGYVGTWYKLGLWGMLLLVGVWAACAVQAFVATRARRLLPAEQALGASMFGALAALAVAANAANPLLQADQVIVIALAFGLSSGLAQRAAT